ALNAVNVPGCSGVALDEEWVLTARHCTIDSAGVSLLSIGTTVDRANPLETRAIREIHRHPTLDIALLRVQPFSHVATHYAPYGLPLNQLENATLTCVGRGANTTPTGGFGIWRSARMVVQPGTTTADGYTFTPENGRIQYRGDSGGPCLYFAASQVFVTGI